MPTANERRALWFLAAVALSGSVVRIARSRALDREADPVLQRQIARVDSVRARGDRVAPRESRRSVRRRAPDTPNAVLSPPVSLDLNQANAAELEGLPGIGPTLAARIVAARDSLHGFRDLDGLCGVRGVGPAMVERLRPMVTLSGERLRGTAPCSESPRAAPKSHPARGPKPR